MIFIGSLDDKIKFTFKMYDSDNDGIIKPDDVRLLLSYMPFNRNSKLVAEENDRYGRHRNIRSHSRQRSLTKQSEGLF